MFCEENRSLSGLGRSRPGRGEVGVEELKIEPGSARVHPCGTKKKCSMVAVCSETPVTKHCPLLRNSSRRTSAHAGAWGSHEYPEAPGVSGTPNSWHCAALRRCGAGGEGNGKMRYSAPMRQVTAAFKFAHPGIIQKMATGHWPDDH